MPAPPHFSLILPLSAPYELRFTNYESRLPNTVLFLLDKTEQMFYVCSMPRLLLPWTTLYSPFSSRYPPNCSSIVSRFNSPPKDLLSPLSTCPRFWGIPQDLGIAKHVCPDMGIPEGLGRGPACPVPAPVILGYCQGTQAWAWGWGSPSACTPPAPQRGEGAIWAWSCVSPFQIALFNLERGSGACLSCVLSGHPGMGVRLGWNIRFFFDTRNEYPIPNSQSLIPDP